MNVITKTFDGVGIEYVEFEPVNPQQVSQVQRDIERHLSAINARQAIKAKKVVASYQENAA